MTDKSFEEGICIGAMLFKSKGLESGEQGEINPLVVTKNGSYRADRDIDGFNPVTVDLPITSKSITENGTYYASDDGAEGFDPVIVNVKTYKEEYEEMKSIVDFLRQSNTDDSDTIDVMLGTADISDVETENHTFTFKVQYVRFMSGVAQGVGSKGDKYEVNILIYRDGEYLFTQRTTINARTEDSSKEDGYGVDQLASCFYWSTDESGIPVLNYRYYAIGSWASYDQWNELSMYNYMD